MGRGLGDLGLWQASAMVKYSSKLNSRFGCTCTYYTAILRALRLFTALYGYIWASISRTSMVLGTAPPPLP